MLKLLHKIRYRNIQPEPLIKIEISQKAILSNYRAFKEMTGIEIAPVLKSNAYGHGLIQIAEILENSKAPFYAVDSFYEAKMLRRASIKTPILIIGYSTFEQINISLNSVAYAITSLTMIRELSKSLTHKKHFHLKIDTGMRRQGIIPDEISAAIKLIDDNQNIIIDGVFSHFADADNPDNEFTLKQINVWNKTVSLLKMKYPDIKHYHISATAGTLFRDRIDSNLIRLGIGLYGIDVYNSGMELKPALSMVAKIAGIKSLAKGEGIGYNLIYKAGKDSKIAIIPAGYFEGVDRRLSNKGKVLIHGTECPIVGRVCMNICMVDVSSVDNVKIGDETVLISNNPADTNSIQNWSSICNTNPHELLVHIPAHLRREVN